MKLLIKQRVFSWSDTYDIYDEESRPKYYVQAEIFSFGHQLHIYDTAQQEVGVIKERLFTLTPQFEIERNGQVEGTIQKQFTFFDPCYKIDCNGWRVEGDFFSWECDVLSGSRVVMHVSKQFLSWGDTYVLEYENPDDEVMGLMIVLAIDAANCRK